MKCIEILRAAEADNAFKDTPSPCELGIDRVHVGAPKHY